MWSDFILPLVSIILAIPGVCLSILLLVDRYSDRQNKK